VDEQFATEIFFPYLFVPFFLIFWFTIGATLHFLSGWQGLQNHFPDRDQDAQKTLRFQSGSMGKALLTGVSYRNCLRYDVCHGGLRIRVLWFLSPLSKPIFVPWLQIRASIERKFILRNCRLSFGQPEIGDLTIGQGAAREIARYSSGKFAETFTAQP